MVGQLIILILTLFLVSGCASIHCHEKRDRSLSSVQVGNQVWIYKYNGRLQCSEKGKEVSLKHMQEELKGIQILKAQNRHDGLMRMSVCGALTGDANAYLIHRKDLSEALERGFQVWNFKKSLEK